MQVPKSHVIDPVVLSPPSLSPMKLRIEQFRFVLPLSNTQNILQILPILLDLQSFLLELLFGSINRLF
jgi:hypothetical protein